MNQKEFLKFGQYLISEVKTLAENGYSKSNKLIQKNCNTYSRDSE